MSCSNYNTKGFGCGGCEHFVKSVSLEVNSGSLEITIPDKKVNNHQKFCIAICQNIPPMSTPDTTIKILLNNVSFYVVDKCGNFIYADQLRSRTVLHVYLATDTYLAMSTNNSRLCSTAHEFQEVDVPITVTSVSRGGATK